MEKNLEKCCPEFNVELWDNKQFTWNNKLFVKTNVCSFFYIPIGFGKKIRKILGLFECNKAQFVEEQCFCKHLSPWKMELLVSTNKTFKGYESVELNGNFYSKVYEGPFKDAGKWTKDFQEILKSKSLIMQDLYYWYTTCPKCAKIYQKNYVVLIAKIK